MFSALAHQLLASGEHTGPLEGASHYGVSGVPGDGPWIELWVVVRDESVTSSAYRTHGCPSSQASAAILCRTMTGREIAVLGEIDGRLIRLLAGGLPEGKGHFADMAVEALTDLLSKSKSGDHTSAL